ncbi:MAG: MBOAT family O-acyltransferase [Oscillospiraceae bacterium]
MVFSSLQFIFLFMPVFFGCYYLVPDRLKNPVLALGSLCFYLVGTLRDPEHFVLFLLSIAVDFAAGLLMERRPQRKKLFLTAGVLFHLLALGAFKYAGFVLGELSRLVPALDLTVRTALPIGISFYTFQGISYLADGYRGRVRAERSLLRYTVYLAMFPQLIAGPIVTYGQVARELRRREIPRASVRHGLGVFVFGLGLKVLLANPVGKLWTQVCAIGFESISTPLAWMAIFAYSFQIYFDFFGYSLMAVGLGEMLGFRLPKNFDHPYLSRSMTEFWRRWHMTLGGWFREYVYVPLGGNRNGGLATVRNLLVVWLLTGIWHGAGYHFVLWGAVLFLLIVTEKFLTGRFLARAPAVGRVYMLLLIPLTWAVFAIEDVGQLGVFFTRLFPFFGQGPWSVFRCDYVKYLRLYGPFLLFGLLFSTKLPYRLLGRLKNRFAVGALLAVIFLASVYCMYRGLDDPFLYFRF